MGFEKNESIDKDKVSTLDDFKGNTDAPFEVVSKNEVPPTYPYAFLNKVKRNWSKICKLMEWEKQGQHVSEKFFMVARNPFAVVALIQNKILERGGKLSQYGTDGKFGKETEEALQEIIKPQNAIPLDALPTKFASETSRPISEKEKEHNRKLNLELFASFFDSLDKIDKRLEEAGLKYIKKEEAGNIDITEADIIAYQTRGMQFREQLVTQEPRLKPLCQIGEKLIAAIEEIAQHIDVTKIKTKADIEKLIKEMSEHIGTQLDSHQNTLNDKELEKLLKEVDKELLMTLFMEIMCEVEIIMSYKLASIEKDHKLDGLEIRKNDPAPSNKAPSSTNAPNNVKINVTTLPANWQDLVDKSPFKKGPIEFQYQHETVTIKFFSSQELNRNDIRIWVGNKFADLSLPSNVTIDSLEALPDGSVKINIRLLEQSNIFQKMLSRKDFESILDKIKSASPKDRIDIGEGTYFTIS